MKKTLITLLASVALVGCGTTTGTTAIQETPVVTLPPVTAPSALDKETNFLNGLTADFPTQVTNLGKADTIELGKLMCGAIDEGTTLQDLLNMSYRLDVDAGFIGALVREEVENFCPENQWFIDAALNA
jgi:glycine cleavage system regulatory protein